MSLDYSPPDHFQVTGFRLDSYTELGPRISIKSDELYLSKKKIGYFRFGLLNELTLSNTKIDIYDRPKEVHRSFSQVEQNPALSPDESSEVSSKTPSPSLYNLDFSILNLPLSRIASIRIAPVEINYFTKAEHIIKIRAARAEIGPPNKELIFRGSVEVVSRDRMLKTMRLKFDPEANRIVSDSCIYIDGSMVQRIENTFISDLYLNRTRIFTDEHG